MRDHAFCGFDLLHLSASITKGLSASTSLHISPAIAPESRISNDNCSNRNCHEYLKGFQFAGFLTSLPDEI